MDHPLNCLVGLVACKDIDPAQAVGQIVSWIQVLGLGGVIIAISEFVEKSKLRTYIFKYSIWFKCLFGFFLGAIVFAVVANLLPLLPGPAWPLIGYPAAWEILSLLSMTAFAVIFSLMSFQQHWFLPKLRAKNLPMLQRVLQSALLDEKSDTSIPAAARFIVGRKGKNLKALIRMAANESEKGHGHAVAIIRELLSTRDYAHYLATADYSQTYYWFVESAKYDWEGGACHGFFESLMRELYQDPNSWLAKEEEPAGLSHSKPLHQAIFTAVESLGFFNAFERSADFSSVHAVRRYFEGLTIALEEYFSDTSYQRGWASPTTTLYYALTNTRNWSWSELPEDKKEAALEHPIRQQMFAVFMFFSHDIPKFLGAYGDEPKLVPQEKSVEDNWVTDGIVECIFNYLEALSVVKNTDIARMETGHVFWLIFQEELKNDVIKNVHRKLVDKVKERVAHSLEGAYSGSMVRLLLDIYGFNFNSEKSDSSELGKFIRELFMSRIAKECIEDEKFAKRHLPTTWWVEKSVGAIFREDWFDYVEQMYPATPKGESKMKLSDFEKKIGSTTDTKSDKTPEIDIGEKVPNHSRQLID